MSKLYATAEKNRFRWWVLMMELQLGLGCSEVLENMFDSLYLEACCFVLTFYRELIDCVIYNCCWFMMEFRPEIWFSRSYGTAIWFYYQLLASFFAFLGPLVNAIEKCEYIVLHLNLNFDENCHNLNNVIAKKQVIFSYLVCTRENSVQCVHTFSLTTSLWNNTLNITCFLKINQLPSSR